MSLETAAIEHACNVIRRQAQEEFRDLTLFFVIHQAGKAADALDNKKREILRHPAGEELFPLMQSFTDTRPGETALAGIAFSKDSKFPLLFRRKKALAGFFVNRDEIHSTENPGQKVNHLAWHCFKLLDHYKNQNGDFYQSSGNTIEPRHTPVSLAHHNMLADAFCAIMLQLQGKNDAIRSLARDRSLMTLFPVPGYRAEEYPYPIAADSAQIVYEDLFEGITSRVKPIAQALEITEEIGYTYDDHSIDQWQEFAIAAQDMAWMGFDKGKILGAAIYTSEDPYVRSMAYLVAEALNLEPPPPGGFNTYNPFTEHEVNERLHSKACEDSFQRVLSTLTMAGDSHLFEEEARRQNRSLMEGHTIGWCAHAMLEVAEALKNITPEQNSAAEKASEIFYINRKKIHWAILQPVSRMIMHLRRDGIEITAAAVIEFCKKDEACAAVAQAFERTS